MLRSSSATIDAYDIVAPAYDLLTEGHAHGPWLASLETLAHDLGVRGRRVLDVACGTGKSFAPLAERGYAVTACDGSPQMAARAAQRGGADVYVADIRALPVFGAFDLVLCLDDVVNHLLEPEEVTEAIAGMGANLARDGVLLFDVNAAAAYEDSHHMVREDDDTFVVWCGGGVALPEPGGTVDLRVEVFAREDGDVWRRSTGRWRHRHYPVEQVAGLVEAAGLRVRAIRGQRRGGVLEPYRSERDHRKVVIAASR
jgi:SAM-dependent methyltransferase